MRTLLRHSIFIVFFLTLISCKPSDWNILQGGFNITISTPFIVIPNKNDIGIDEILSNSQIASYQSLIDLLGVENLNEQGQAELRELIAIAIENQIISEIESELTEESLISISKVDTLDIVNQIDLGDIEGSFEDALINGKIVVEGQMIVKDIDELSEKVDETILTGVKEVYIEEISLRTLTESEKVDLAPDEGKEFTNLAFIDGDEQYEVCKSGQSQINWLKNLDIDFESIDGDITQNALIFENDQNSTCAISLIFNADNNLRTFMDEGAYANFKIGISLPSERSTLAGRIVMGLIGGLNYEDASSLIMGLFE
ncbi:MAG: hypothetical protein HOE90_13285 [Bacteriovoracaceae bacterium]|jgi:hypothetical protein|nr:hypothetical protein [Bacteriovoracaceae bacterium]